MKVLLYIYYVRLFKETRSIQYQQEQKQLQVITNIVFYIIFQENDEKLSQDQRLFENEKMLWEDERRQLNDDVETLKEQIKLLDLQKAALERELRHQLENGWESQLPQLLQWVQDEQEARVYLQVKYEMDLFTYVCYLSYNRKG